MIEVGSVLSLQARAVPAGLRPPVPQRTPHPLLLSRANDILRRPMKSRRAFAAAASSSWFRQSDHRSWYRPSLGYSDANVASGTTGGVGGLIPFGRSALHPRPPRPPAGQGGQPVQAGHPSGSASLSMKYSRNEADRPRSGWSLTADCHGLGTQPQSYARECRTMLDPEMRLGEPALDGSAEADVQFFASSLFGVGRNDRSCLITDVFRFG